MAKRLGKHFRGNVVGYIALFVALGIGTAYALDRNSVKSKHIAPGHVKLSDTNDKLRLKCQGGTRYHEGACIEKVARGSATWNGAETDCRDDGRRLPTVAELYTFRHEPSINFVGTGEWTLQHDEGGTNAVAVPEAGQLLVANESLNLSYRCAARPKL